MKMAAGPHQPTGATFSSWLGDFIVVIVIFFSPLCSLAFVVIFFFPFKYFGLHPFVASIKAGLEKWMASIGVARFFFIFSSTFQFSR